MNISKIIISIASTLVLYTFSLVSCSSANSSNEISDIEAKNIFIKDLGNNANASDIVISFTKPANIDLVETFKIYLVKSEKASSFTIDFALTLVNSMNLEKKESSTNLHLADSLLDSDGDLIIENRSYVAFILSVSTSSETVLSKPSNELQLERKNFVRTLVKNIDGGSGGVAMDTEGNIYMADFGLTLGGPPGSKVFKVTEEGQVSIFATGFVGASGNDFDTDGNLYQSNIAGQSISKITPSGNVSTYVSGSPIVNTVGIVFENDTLFVADCDGHQILKIDPEKNISILGKSAPLNCPNGLTKDDEGNLYASNFYNGNVIKITKNGEMSIITTLPGNNNGHLTYHSGFLYVIARTANQIYKVGLDGTSFLFAGSGKRGNSDGSALQATFSLPNDLIFSNDSSKIYLNDVVPTNGSNIAPCNIRVIEVVDL